MNIEGISCQNCKNFIQYYRKDATRFSALSIGHCAKHLTKTKLTPCNDWDDLQIKTEKDKQTLLSTLTAVSKKLNQIIELLTYEAKG